MAGNEPVIRITADEINCLVYAYLVDSGFKHTAFSLCMEGRLENSPNFSKHIPRGELVDLLSKSLLYREVESHWKADYLATNCKAGFSLLEAHICSLEPPKPKSVPLPLTYTQRPLAQSNGVTDGKRKASPNPGDGPLEKRPRRDDDMDVDLYRGPESSARKPIKPKHRQQGPGDNDTDPRAILVLSGHDTEVFVCAFNPVQQSILVTGSKDAVVNLWKLPNPPPINSPEFAQRPGAPLHLAYFENVDQGDLTALHWNAAGTLVAIGSYDTVLRVCTAEGELYFTHKQHRGPIFAVRFSKDGKWLLTASLDSTACLWDVEAKELKTQYQAHIDCCLDIDWLTDTMFASCSADQLIYIMDIGKDKPIKALHGHTNEINQIKCNPSGTRLASCSDDMTARIWKVDNISTSSESEPSIPGLEKPDEAVVLSGHKHSVSMICWCPDYPAGTNEIIATSSFDGTARLWDSVTGECLQVFSDHKRPVYALKFNPTGRWIATGSGDGWLHIYDVKAREIVWSWFAGFEKPGVFEIDWQTNENLDRIALALECRNVAVIDVSKVPALQKK